MPVHFANGLFDQPWLVAIFIIVGLISNWLMKRRQEKEAARRPEGESPPAPEKPEQEFDLETAMRRLLGEAPPSQPPPQPPVIPGASRPPSLAEADQPDADELQPAQAWREEAPEGWAEARELPRPPSPSAPGPRVGVAVVVPTEAQAQAARRFAQSSAAGGQRPATGVHEVDWHSHGGARAADWRNPRKARQAFVASLVFGPPKGLEP